ncbi:MAG: peptidoglycan editing factor PgeF [Bacillota bacterium]
MFVVKSIKNIRYLQFSKFPINLLFTLKDETKNMPSQTSKKELYQYYNIDEKNIVQLHQVHSNRVFHLGNVKKYQEIEPLKADAIISINSKVILKTIHADCLPIYFYNPKKSILGLAHAGWQGTLNKIVAKVIHEMEFYYEAKAETTYVVIGPGIDGNNYQVSKDLYSSFNYSWSGELDFFKKDTTSKDKYFLDLKQANKQLLLANDIKAENIFISDYSTYLDDDLFHSYRREGDKAGRMTALLFWPRREM